MSVGFSSLDHHLPCIGHPCSYSYSIEVTSGGKVAGLEFDLVIPDASILIDESRDLASRCIIHDERHMPCLRNSEWDIYNSMRRVRNALLQDLVAGVNKTTMRGT